MWLLQPGLLLWRCFCFIALLSLPHVFARPRAAHRESLIQQLKSAPNYSNLRHTGHCIVVLKPEASRSDVLGHRKWLTSLDEEDFDYRDSDEAKVSVYRRKRPRAGQRKKWRQMISKEFNWEPAIMLSTNPGEARASQRSSSFRGYSGQFHPDVLEKIRRRPEVHLVEPDYFIHLSGVDDKPLVVSEPLDADRKEDDSLKFADQSALSGNGTGIIAYVIDSGIYANHTDFENRVSLGHNFVEGEDDMDQCGHGSHIAGIIGGQKYGLATDTRIVSVKVFDSRGRGSVSRAMKGVEWAAMDARNRHESADKDGKTFKGAIINMSMSAPRSAALNMLIESIVNDLSIPIVVAAGNESKDACQTSPASAELSLTVMGVDKNNTLAIFSNYGRCTTIAAPGVDILSVGTKGPYSSSVKSGTSMAAAVVSGVLAKRMSLQPASRIMTAPQVREWIASHSHKDVVHFPSPAAESPSLLIAM